MLETIIAGTVGGFGWALLGNAKIFTDPNVKFKDVFEPKKVAKSLVVGALIGGYAGYNGVTVDYTTMETLSAGTATFTFATAIGNKVVDIVWNSYKWIREKF